MSRLQFQLEAKATGSRARAATFRTLHNEVKTPIFMPVGTRATVRTQHFETLEEVDAQVLLANTYHLLLRPGPEVFRQMGGIHGFMNWKRSVLTDSGGFQIFSLPHARMMREEGAEFRSYVDKRKIVLSPELSIDMQRAIGSDIMMVLDQCVPSTCERSLAEEAMQLTHRWAKRSLVARGDSLQSLFGIVQGACFPDLRKESADFLTQLPFDGFAIGGLAVGESRNEREDFTELTAQLLPENLPRYLMGVGTPLDLLEAVHRGVDMFDCILPTAWAQQGIAFTSRGRVDFRRGVYRLADESIDPACACPSCRRHSRAYLHHLVKTKEMLGWQLLGVHNLHFYLNLMREIRASILNDTFMELYRAKKPFLECRDDDNPVKRPRKRKPKDKTPVRSLGRYEVHTSEQGFSSIRDAASGEIMHSVSDPRVEARRLYVEQPRLAERIKEPGAPELVLWDVGLGAATNAMEAIRCYEETVAGAEAVRPLHLVSFENDLDSLRLALLHPYKFDHLRHSAPFALIEEGEWRSKSGLPLRWTLLEGDFLKRLEEAPAPDLILFDPFSYKTDKGLWSVECFKKIYESCRGRETELFTYSNSTAVRAALLAAGFFVAKGVGTGPKQETTVAFTAPSGAEKYDLLPVEWLARWDRSGSRVMELDAAVRSHRQFQFK